MRISLCRLSSSSKTGHSATLPYAIPKALLQRNEARRVSGTDTGATVLNRLVRDRELAKVVANHLQHSSRTAPVRRESRGYSQNTVCPSQRLQNQQRELFAHNQHRQGSLARKQSWVLRTKIRDREHSVHTSGLISTDVKTFPL